MDFAEHLADLERRVSAIEERLPAPSPLPARRPSAERPAPHGGEFWALEGLQERVTAPGAVMIVGSVRAPQGTTAVWQESATTRDLLETDWDGAAELLAALAHPARLRIVKEVLAGRATAKELAESESMGSTGQVYHHIRALVAAGWLRTRARGHHEVPVERIVPLLSTVLAGRR